MLVTLQDEHDSEFSILFHDNIMLFIDFGINTWYMNLFVSLYGHKKEWYTTVINLSGYVYSFI